MTWQLLMKNVADLETDNHQTKRRVTDYCFQRVKENLEAPPPSQLPTVGNIRQSYRTVGSHTPSCMPVVRATYPGAEIREEAERRAAQQALRDRYLSRDEPAKQTTPPLNDSKRTSPKEPPKQCNRPVGPLRQFHLSPWPKISHLNHTSGIQKRKRARRNYLATFVESPTASKFGSKFLDEIGNKEQGAGVHGRVIKTPVVSQAAEESINNVPRQPLKIGQSIHDHPSTWNLDSDQLAEELTAFALEISQNEEQEKPHSKNQQAQNMDTKDTNMNMDEDFTYDTYIRVPISDGKSGEGGTNDVGLLVVEDEDQELWQTFVESDNDSEWDEEDPDSNGLCKLGRYEHH